MSNRDCWYSLEASSPVSGKVDQGLSRSPKETYDCYDSGPSNAATQKTLPEENGKIFLLENGKTMRNSSDVAVSSLIDLRSSHRVAKSVHASQRL